MEWLLELAANVAEFFVRVFTWITGLVTQLPGRMATWWAEQPFTAWEIVLALYPAVLFLAAYLILRHLRRT